MNWKTLSGKLSLYKFALIALSSCALLSACGFEKYFAKPIDPAANISKFQQKDPAGQDFRQYLNTQNYITEQWPIAIWGPDELTYCALFFHPSLDVARAQWRAAEASGLATTERPLPNVNSSLARSDRANGDINPFAYGLSIDIPIETASKRGIRIESAQHLSEAAKLEIAQTAWQLRSQVVQSYDEYQFNQQQIRLLTEEDNRQQEIVAMYQKRVSLGAASNVELSLAKLRQQTASTELNSKLRYQEVLIAKLASNLGLPVDKVQAMQLGKTNDSQVSNAPTIEALQQLSPAELQASALLNRLDIRIALEKYAAAESKLKLEIAKQYPDIVLSPGYIYEFGDRVWSLGLSGLLNILTKNKLAIKEATQLREVEIAQFEALQTQVITELQIALAEAKQSQEALANQQNLLKQQAANLQQMERRFKLGEIDRMELAYAKLENNAAEKSLAMAQFQLESALHRLENTMQQPITSAKERLNLEAAVRNQTQ